MRRMNARILPHRRVGDLRPFGVIFVDINELKQINDRLGHDVGDSVLKELTQRLRSSLRERDLVARYGGDEFIVLLDDVDSRLDAETVRTNLEASLCLPLSALATLAPEMSTQGASIGLAMFPEDALDADMLVKHADVDMYARKGTGK